MGLRKVASDEFLQTGTWALRNGQEAMPNVKTEQTNF